MHYPPLSPAQEVLVSDPTNTRGTRSFWKSRVLPYWLPLLLALAFGGAAAVLIARGLLFFLIPLAAVVPVTILFLRYPFVAIIIWIVVFPYFVQEPAGAGRYMYWLLHRLMIPAALGIVVLSDWFRLRKVEPVRFGRAELSLTIFLLVASFGIVTLVPNPAWAFIRFYDRVFVPLSMYWLVRLLSPTERDLSRLAWAGLITIYLQVAIGLVAWFAPGILPEQWLNREGQRTVGSFGNPAVYTSTLIFLSLLFLQQGMQGTSKRVRTLALITLGVTYFCVFFSFSRGSWLGGVLVLVGLIFIYRKVMLRLVGVGVFVSAILSITLLANQLGYAFERLRDEDTAQGRVLGATTALRMIRERPLFGWGFTTYDLYDEQYKTRVGNLAIRQQQTSHNTYLLFIAEMGVINLLLYMFPAVWWLLLSWRVWRRMPQHGFKGWHLLAMLWLLLLDHFTVSNFMDMIQANMFGTTIWWMALGLVATLVYPHLRPADFGGPRWIHQQTESGLLPPKRLSETSGLASLRPSKTRLLGRSRSHP
jgi:O-antigen ligase